MKQIKNKKDLEKELLKRNFLYKVFSGKEMSGKVSSYEIFIDISDDIRTGVSFSPETMNNTKKVDFIKFVEEQIAKNVKKQSIMKFLRERNTKNVIYTDLVKENVILKPIKEKGEKENDR